MDYGQICTDRIAMVPWLKVTNQGRDTTQVARQKYPCKDSGIYFDIVRWVRSYL